MLRSVMCLHEGAKSKARVDHEMSREIEEKDGMWLGSELPAFPSTFVVDVITRTNKIMSIM